MSFEAILREIIFDAVLAALRQHFEGVETDSRFAAPPPGPAPAAPVAPGPAPAAPVASGPAPVAPGPSPAAPVAPGLAPAAPVAPGPAPAAPGPAPAAPGPAPAAPGPAPAAPVAPGPAPAAPATAGGPSNVVAMPAPTALPEMTGPTLDDLRAAANDFHRAHPELAGQFLLEIQGYGVHRLTELPATAYAPLLKWLQSQGGAA